MLNTEVIQINIFFRPEQRCLPRSCDVMCENEQENSIFLQFEITKIF